MKILMFLVLALMMLNSSSFAQDTSKPLAAIQKKWEDSEKRWEERKNKWQGHLRIRKFSFPRDKCGLFTSMNHFSATCQLHVVLTPENEMFIKFVREDKELLILPGRYGSVFRTADEKLYFAHFGPSGQGCSVSAYDLTSGKKLWETNPFGCLGGGFSGYSNHVLMALSGLNQVQDEPEGAAIIITGNEGMGHYIAVLDRETGKMLAHKIYGKKFWMPPLTDRERADGRF